MPNPFIFLFLIFAALFLVLAYFFYHKLSRRSASKVQTRLSEKERERVFFETDSEKFSFNRKSLHFRGQSREWKQSMRQLGETLKEKSVEKIIYVHGTFAGDDPFGLLDFISEKIPMSKKSQRSLRKLLIKGKNRLFHDLGHFSENYIALTASALKIPTYGFNWSSQNNHLARVKASLELLDFIESKPTKETLLLIGHSHAGSLFCLLSAFSQQKEWAQKILKICQYETKEIQLIENKLAVFKTRKIDFVTLGCPFRYQWVEHSQFRLLNIINHRGKSVLGGLPSGVITTKDGDYIQQWGISGSDTLALTTEQRQINYELDKYLDPGNDLSLWIEKISSRQRIPPAGTVILADYKDQSVFPNLHKTLFGHGTYTRYEKIIFNFHLIAKYLYK